MSVEIRRPATVYLDLGDETAWNPDIENLQFQDGQFADILLIPGSDSSILKCTNLNFSSIPAGSTLKGMTFYVDNYFDELASGMPDIAFAWTLVNSGADLGAFRISTQSIDDGSNAWQDGDGTSFFGYPITIGVLNSSSFGYKFKCANVNSKPFQPGFDLIEIGITYDPPVSTGASWLWREILGTV